MTDEQQKGKPQVATESVNRPEVDDYDDFDRDFDGGEEPSRKAGSFRAGIWGAIGGMALFTGLFGLCIWMSARAGVTFFDVKNQTVIDIVKSDYPVHIALYEFKILLAYLIVGGPFGFYFGLVGGGFYSTDKRKSRITCFFAGLLGAAIAQALVMLFAIGAVPAVYSKYFYEAGAPLSAIQAIATEFLVPPVALFLLALYFLSTLYSIFRRTLGKAAKPAILAVCALLIVAGVSLKFFGKPPVFAVRDGKPNVLILAADSLRPDRLSLSGHYNKTSPNIDELAKSSFVFENAFAVMARTFPSWASILTGQYPHTHGIRDMFPDPKYTDLDHSVVTALRSQGYRTGVFANYAGDIFPRMDAGFETTSAPNFTFTSLVDTNIITSHFLLLPYLDNHLGHWLFPILNGLADFPNPTLVTDRLLDFIDSDAEQPFMAVTFYSAPHFPYATRWPYYKKFTEPEYQGRFKYRRPTDLGTVPIDNDDILQIRGLFDGATNAFDNEVKRIIEALKQRKLMRETIIIITSDHGENLHENLDDFAHGDQFRGNQSVRVPLIIYWPRTVGSIGLRGRPRKVDALVSHVDLVPTLNAALGLKMEGRMDGSSMEPLMTGGAEETRDAVYAETGLWMVDIGSQYLRTRRINYPGIEELGFVDPETKQVRIKDKYKDIINIAKHRMIFDGRIKVISLPTEQGIRYECYDTVTDPEEKDDLYYYYPQVCDNLRDRLNDWIASAPNSELINGFAIPTK